MSSRKVPELRAIIPGLPVISTMRALLGVGHGRQCQRGSVALMLAASLLPLSMAVGLAIDYSFLVSSRAQLNLAADAAAMHAVRVASSMQTTIAGQTAAGTQAGQQWFAAQLGTLSNASVSNSGLSVSVTYGTAPSTYTATVSYSGSVPTHFASLFGLGSFPISGTATSVISNQYVEVLMLLDNSPSMLIGSSTSDIVALEQATVCAQVAQSSTIDSGEYTWTYPAHSPTYGFGPSFAVPPSSQVGSCNSAYDGDPSACPYMMNLPNISKTTGKCTNGGGGAGMYMTGGSNYPQTPCGFACHSDANNNDFFGIARSIGVTLRLDVVQQAAINVISTMQSDEMTPNQFTIGVYQFNNALQQLYPTSGEASTNLTAAQTAVQNIKNNPPLTTDTPDTNFPAAANALAAQVTSGGSGLSPAAPRKNLFIVTDGMNDTGTTSTQVLGPMTSSTSETICQQFKAKGFAVYVLYTPYLPMPIHSYLTQGKAVAEPTTTSSNIQALQACSSGSSYFFTATSATAINQAMASMLSSALNSAGRISH